MRCRRNANTERLPSRMRLWLTLVLPLSWWIRLRTSRECRSWETLVSRRWSLRFWRPLRKVFWLRFPHGQPRLCLGGTRSQDWGWMEPLHVQNQPPCIWWLLLLGWLLVPRGYRRRSAWLVQWCLEHAWVCNCNWLTSLGLGACRQWLWCVASQQ